MTQSLHRFAYASHSTFNPFASPEGIDVNIAQILEAARQNNKKNNLVGALYYGNGCFFLCFLCFPLRILPPHNRTTTKTPLI